MRVLGLKPNRNLSALNARYEQGSLRPVIDGPYPFAELPAAMQRFGEAAHLGKVVVAVV